MYNVSNRRARVAMYACAAAAAVAILPAALADPIGNPGPFNGWDTTSAVSIIRHSGQRDTELGAAGRTVINTINGSGMDFGTGLKHNNGAPSGQEAAFATPPTGTGQSPPNPGTLQST